VVSDTLARFGGHLGFSRQLFCGSYFAVAVSSFVIDATVRLAETIFRLRAVLLLCIVVYSFLYSLPLWMGSLVVVFDGITEWDIQLLHVYNVCIYIV
jgi:hypothetical protein